MATFREHEEVLGMDEKKTDPWWEDVFQGAGQQVCEKFIKNPVIGIVIGHGYHVQTIPNSMGGFIYSTFSDVYE